MLITSLPKSLFEYEVLPYMDDPRQVIGLRCVNKAAKLRFTDLAKCTVRHFMPQIEEAKRNMEAMERASDI
jgi:hypothetical protein